MVQFIRQKILKGNGLISLWKSSKLQIIGSGLLIALSFAVLGWLVYRQKDFILSYSWKVNFFPLVISLILYGLTQLVIIYVWSRILTCFGNTLSFKDHFRYYCLSTLAKRLPGTVWYVVWRAQLYQKEGISIVETSFSSGVELAIGVISGMFVIIIFSASLLLQYQFGFLGFLVVILLGIFLFRPQVMRRIFYYFAKREVVVSYRESFFWVFLYSIGWILGGALLFMVILSVYPLSYSSIGFVIGSWTLVGVLSTVLFLLPTNFGLNQVGISLLLSNIIPSPIAVVVAIFSRVLLTLYEVLWALFAYLPNLLRKKE